MARRLLRSNWFESIKTEKDYSRYNFSYLVLTAAAMLGVSYPKEAGINHKIVNAFDIPTYKMTPHF